jgi:hypothetical protein
MENFKHTDLKLPSPEWGSSIVAKLMELARLQLGSSMTR